MKKYVKSLQLLQRKLEKKLKSLESNLTDHMLAKSGIFHSFQNSFKHLKPPYLSLQSVLDDFYKSENEFGAMPSLSLFYFLDFLEGKKDIHSAMHNLRFCQAAEKYRRLVWRLTTGILEEYSPFIAPSVVQSAKTENFTRDTHSRFQKEVKKIYKAFFLSSTYTIDVSKDVLASFKRYVDALEKPSLSEAFSQDDYQCVLKAQQTVILQLEDAFDEFLHTDSYFKWVRFLNPLLF